MTTTTTTLSSGYFSWITTVRYEHLIAGMCAGMASTLVLHPLDLIKTRFAVNPGNFVSYRGIFNAFGTIFRQDGFLGLYRGVVPNFWGAGASWGLYFLFYNSIKAKKSQSTGNKPLSAGAHLLAASEAGVITLMITNPIWVVKTRMCLQFGAEAQEKSTPGGKITPQPPVKYKGTLDALVKIYKMEGFLGYYKGFLPGVFGVSHGAVQFMVYEELKKEYNTYKGREHGAKFGTMEYLSFAAISKLIAVAVTYPYQVVRARLQDQHHYYAGVKDCVTRTSKNEGWRGFYKGMGTNLLRVTPATMITFLTYENVSNFLINRSKNP